MHSKVGKLVGVVIADFVLEIAFTLFDVCFGGMPFDFSGSLVVRVPLGDGMPSDVSKIAVSLQIPFLVKQIYITGSLAISLPQFVGRYCFEDDRGFGEHGGTVRGKAHTYKLSKGGYKCHKLLSSGAACLTDGSSEKIEGFGFARPFGKPNSEAS